MNTKQKVILQIMCKFQVNTLDSLILNSGLDNLISKSRSQGIILSLLEDLKN